MRTFSLAERLEPVGDLVEAFFACRLGHARIHIGVFVRLTRDSGLQIVARRTDRQPGRRIADNLEVFEMPVGMPGLAFRR